MLTKSPEARIGLSASGKAPAKDVFCYLPLADWKLLHDAAARFGYPINTVVALQMRPLLRQLEQSGRIQEFPTNKKQSGPHKQIYCRLDLPDWHRLQSAARAAKLPITQIMEHQMQPLLRMLRPHRSNVR